MITVDDLRASLRKPKFGDDELDSADNALLQRYLAAAQSYVKNAVGSDDAFLTDPDNTTLYETVVLAIAGAYYQNPVAVVAGSAPVTVDLVAGNLIGQLRARWEVSQDGAISNTNQTGSGGGAGESRGGVRRWG